MIGNTAVLFVLGGILLVGGAELLVRGASRLAVAAGITPLVVGLTVVAFGTSAPELAVTVGAAASGQGDVALGNVVGSNIFNVLFILGLSALLAPLVVAQQLVRLDVPLLIGVSLGVVAMGIDGRIGRLDGALLVAAGTAYTLFLVRQSRRETAGVQAEYEEAFGGEARRRSPWPRDVALIAVGLALLVVGARWLVRAAVETATALGVSELVIGLTIVAAGTSLPEVATSVLASLRGERDIAVGNVVGSCLFNLLFVLGVGSLAAPAGVAVPPGALTFDLPVMLAVSVAALPVVFTGYAIARWEGAVFLVYYAAYTLFLVLDAARHDALHELRAAMVLFFLPLTALTLAVLTARALRRGRAPGA
ncbi:MAG TPA: calcium/sodium antiporter [Longimicrobium sp.]|nr:calcium/sodium antiporter [Longimicrobium sp.]